MPGDPYRLWRVKDWRAQPFAGLSPLPPSAQSLALFLHLSGASTNLPGLALGGRGALLDGLRWKPRDLDRCLAELERAGAVVDVNEAQAVFMPWCLAGDPPANPKALMGWRNRLEQLPECPARRRIVTLVHAFLQGYRAEWRDTSPVELWSSWWNLEATSGEPHADVPQTVAETVSETVAQTVTNNRRQEAGSRNQEAGDRTQDPPAPPEGARALAENLRADWNTLTSPPIPRCMAMTPKRHAHARARLADVGADKLREAMRRIEGSTFCRGESGGWVATFDWLIESPDNATKVLEGKYDNRERVAKLAPAVPGRVPAPPGKYANVGLRAAGGVS